MTQPLSGITPYIYGTTRLGDSSLDFKARVALAHQAMEGKVWFHTSHQYGNALEVLEQAFREQPGLVPPLIFKVGWESADEVRATILQLKKAVRVDRMHLGQLCLNGELADDFRRGGASCEAFQAMRREGLVDGFVLQVFPWTSEVAMEALLAGHAEQVVDGYILYLNPLQRFASNELWSQLQQRQLPVIGMRTVAGGHVRDLRDVPGAAWKPYLQERAVQVAPLFDSSGIQSWAEFCLRFAHSIPGVVASVGSTSTPARLQELMQIASGKLLPLPEPIMASLWELQQHWAATVDVHGIPGSM